MSALTPCFACRRHVRVLEPACPFCGAPREADAGAVGRSSANGAERAKDRPRRAVHWNGVSRAARLALNVAIGAGAAGCGSATRDTTAPAAGSAMPAATEAGRPSASAAPSAAPAPSASESAAAPEPGVPHRVVAIYGMTIVIVERVQFAPQSVEIEASQDNVLTELAETMKGNGAIRVIVEGHADTGEKGDRKALSDARARVVLERLVKLGVDRARLVARGFGTTQPLDPNDAGDPEAAAKNRACSFHLADEHGDPLQ